MYVTIDSEFRESAMYPLVAYHGKTGNKRGWLVTQCRCGEPVSIDEREVNEIVGIYSYTAEEFKKKHKSIMRKIAVRVLRMLHSYAD